MKNGLRECWRRGRPAVNGWLMMPSPVAAEIVAAQPFDALTIDMQHGLIGYESALAMLQAMQSSAATPMARLPSLDADVAGRLLDAGALGVIGPMVNSAESAARLVSACRYPPNGARSFGPMRAALRHGASYARDANDEVIVLGMIETAEALDNLAAIVGTPGLDGVYIGPSDLGLSLGYPPKFDHDEPEMLDHIARIRAAAHAAHKRVGVHCLTAEYARRMIADGFDLVTVGSDGRWLGEGAAAAATQILHPGAKGQPHVGERA